MAPHDTTTTPPPEPVAERGPEPTPWFRRRPVTMTAYVVAFVAWWLVIGLPTDPMIAFVWLWLATIAWNGTRPWRTHLAFARDWVPVVVLLVAYDFSRGLADNGAAPHVTEMIRADRWLFGGTLPTVWMQDHLYDPDRAHWYDVAASWIYFSHFVASLGTAVVLWLRSRPLWAAFMRRWFALTAAGLATYFLYPAAPPWWASKYGYIAEPVERMSGRGWEAIGLHGAGKLLNAGQALSNPVAAIPSLHSAFSLSLVVFFLTRVRKRWISLLLAYPLAMSTTLVYTGEHYVVDALVGYTYVGIVYLTVWLAERGWRAYRARRTDPAERGAAADAAEGAGPPDGTGPPAQRDPGPPDARSPAPSAAGGGAGPGGA